MQKRVVLVTAAVAALGLAAVALGFVAEGAKSKAFVGFDERSQSCVYRRTPALFCGVAAALLVVAALALSTAAGGCCSRYSAAGAPPAAAGGTRRPAAVKLYSIGWLLAVGATVMFLYGASRNAGGTTGLSVGPANRRGGYYYYGCAVLRGGVFVMASILSAAATTCAVAAYVQHQQAEEPAPPGQYPAPAVAMGQPQWSQPYPYPPAAYPPPAVGYPAPPHYGGGYGPK